MNQLDLQKLKEMRQHLGKLHEEWKNNPESDGHCKSNEGYVGLLYRMKNWHESESLNDYVEAKPELSLVEVYSYLFGPSRLHTFDTIEQAHKEVMRW